MCHLTTNMVNLLQSHHESTTKLIFNHQNHCQPAWPTPPLRQNCAWAPKRIVPLRPWRMTWDICPWRTRGGGGTNQVIIAINERGEYWGLVFDWFPRVFLPCWTISGEINSRDAIRRGKSAAKPSQLTTSRLRWSMAMAGAMATKLGVKIIAIMVTTSSTAAAYHQV